ncbi:MAG: iron-sulfur cluster carrier protein ApbC [Gammaproteobacteria bacterium]|nr:iron-sulfur cluster carrier protein ApbC [Gammaproteobacteria bacterium]MCW5583517.1 iron-sulfur cluster carrier protein ApbC [Gammaproteobacteria bacterium]
MQNVTLQKEIENKLAQYGDPYLGIDLFAAKSVKNVTIMEDKIFIEIVLGYPYFSLKDKMITSITNLLAPFSAGKSLDIHLGMQIDAHTGKQSVPVIPGVKNMIAVASGKGGVGKSTIAVNLALALAKEGARIGLLDADIYGPSQPTMLGAAREKPVIKDRTIEPIERHGIQSMSIGYLVDSTAAMAWRGPMLGKALEQLMYDTKWNALDYLIVDLPPGTGDIQLTLCQKMPVSGAVVVTTPQDLALLDVRRACEMFNKLNVPILGVIENMSHYHCKQCGHEEKIFGEGGAAKLAKEYALTHLGAIPLDLQIREMTDGGHPLIVHDAENSHSKIFCELARKVAAKLALQTKNYSIKFPKIIVQHDKKAE